jgi:hypothetical protein
VAKELPVTYNVPDEVKRAARSQLAYLIRVCPGWVNHLHVGFESNPEHDDKGSLAHIQADYPYRRVYLTIFPGWLWEGETLRRETIIHEAAHILNAPIQNFIHRSIKAVFKENTMAERVFEAAWQQANEAATEDTARALMETAGWGPTELKAELEDEEVAQPAAVSGTETPQQIQS